MLERRADGALMHPEKLIDELRAWRIVPDRLRYWARERPDHPFVQCESPWLSFAEVDRRTDRIAAGLHEIGVRKGDCVAVILPNRIEMVLVIFALSKLGAILVPLNTFLKGEFLTYQLVDSTAHVVITDAPGARETTRLRDKIPQLSVMVLLGEREGERLSKLEFDRSGLGDVRPVDFVDVEASAAARPSVDLVMRDPISILYTSGTTGMPKGCVLSHGYYMAVPWAEIWADVVRPDDIIFSTMPLFHAGAGVRQLMQALVLGIPTCFDVVFSATSFIRRAREVGATTATLMAAMANAVLARPPSPDDRNHSLRCVTLNALKPRELDIFEERFGVMGQSLGIGQTEAIGITKGHMDMRILKRGTLGPAGRGFEVALFDDEDRPVDPGQIGELVIRPREPEMMFQGYWRKPEATLSAFRSLWYHTGDLASVDGDGYHTFKGRKTDSMRRRGENVSAVEVEYAIVQHPDIAAAAVHSVPSPLGEDDIKACIVLLEEKTIEAPALFEFFRQNLPYFAIPRYVEFLDELPANAMGRVMKHVLKERGVAGAIDFECLGIAVEGSARRS